MVLKLKFTEQAFLHLSIKVTKEETAVWNCTVRLLTSWEALAPAFVQISANSQFVAGTKAV